MLKAELQSILDTINNVEFSGFIEYQNTLKLLIEKLQHLSREDKSPMLDAWLSMGLTEIRKELDRLNSFNNFMPEKQKVEFMYSRSTVTMSLTNIIMNM